MLDSSASRDPELLSRVWFATDGVVAMGPASFQQLGMALAAGKLAATTLIRHEQWLAWVPLHELEGLSEQERSAVVGRLARASDRAPRPELSPPSRPDDELPESSGKRSVPRSSIRPAAVDPVGVLSTASDLKEAMLLLLSTAVAAASAQRGAVYQVGSDALSATVVGTFGTATELLLGTEVDRDDAGFRAVLRGAVVVGDADSGPAGRSIRDRLGLTDASPHGVASIPLSVDGQLVAILELGQLCRPFRAREIARAEDVMDVFAERCVVMGWFS